MSSFAVINVYMFMINQPEYPSFATPVIQNGGGYLSGYQSVSASQNNHTTILYRQLPAMST